MSFAFMARVSTADVFARLDGRDLLVIDVREESGL
jgi:hypothetical protein